MRIVSIANQKGGCGKTTVAVNLASALARSGLKVLLLDNDPQGHSSLALGKMPEDFSLSTRDLYLTSDVLVEDLSLVINENLDLIPADVDLSTVEQQLAQVVDEVVAGNDVVSTVAVQLDRQVIVDNVVTRQHVA